MRKDFRMKDKSAITLIALVFSIIIMLILAGVTLNFVLGEDGIIDRALQAAFISDMKQYQEKVELYVASNMLKAYRKDEAEPIINVGLEEQPGIETVITDINDKYKDQVIVQRNTMYYKYTGNSKRVKWCFEMGIPVWGYSSYEDFIDNTVFSPVTKGEYAAVDGVYCCAPDLTGFNPKRTYYVLYDEEGNETIGNTLQKGAPENITDWYNYASSVKKWANIVTIGGDGNPENLENDRAYFVWIPRYVYKLDKDAQEADIKFVDLNNYYKDFSDSTKDATYNDLTPTYDENGYQTNYCLPAAFKWDSTDISGFWVSKYEVSALYAQDVIIKDVEFILSDTTIKLNSINATNTGSIGIAYYEVYLDGDSVGTPATITTSNPYTIQNLYANTEYTIKVMAKQANGTVLGIYEETVKTTEKPISELTKPNLMGFSKTNTYYVTYDSEGTETIGDKVQYDANGVPTNIPNGWYDYENKLWANIVTIGGDADKTNEDNPRAYFTWIPRYEYKLKEVVQEIGIRFIPPTQTTANTSIGYKLPEAFKWDNTNVSGFWVSKYEVSAIE